MDGIKLSVIIATFNRRKILERTLPHLLAQDLSPQGYELIYVVDGSTDGTVEMLKGLKTKCALEVIEQPHKGPGAARNKGIGAARGDLVLFLDDDIICPASLLGRHCAAHPTLGPCVAQGPILIAPDSPRSLARYNAERWYEARYRRLLVGAGQGFPFTPFTIVNSSTSRKTLLEWGGFDERFAAQEDYELNLRLRKLGARYQFLPEALVYEIYVKSSLDYMEGDGESYGKAEVRLCRKHTERRPLSLLAGMAETTGWKRVLRQRLVDFPISPIHLFTGPVEVCERLSRIPLMRKAGRWLLAYGRRVMELRGAINEAGDWKSLRSEFGMRLPVLLYHHVGPARRGTCRELTVSPCRFEQQVRWLARRGYVGIRPSDWSRWRGEGKRLPDKPVLLTFDDGYADLAEYAFPVLRRFGFSAGVYIVTGQLGGTNAWDEVSGSATHPLLTAEQIRYWSAEGIEFGAHSRTHTDLTTLSDSELVDEVLGSQEDMAKVLGTRAGSFAYPYGIYNKAVLDSVRGTFDLAFVGDGQKVGMDYLRTDPHLLLRMMVHPGESLFDLECRLQWGHDPLPKLRAWIRPRTRLRRLASSLLGRSH